MLHQGTSSENVRLFGSNAMDKRCFALPGQLRQLVQEGKTEQQMVLTSGPDGCFREGGNSLIKYMVIGKYSISVKPGFVLFIKLITALGKRNEHQKPVRDGYIQVQQQNMLPGKLSEFGN